jgi:hypothetical protein
VIRGELPDAAVVDSHPREALGPKVGVGPDHEPAREFGGQRERLMRTDDDGGRSPLA